MADFLDTLGTIGKTVGQTALAVPEAIGGTALDVLIGDRTNVPVGEQVKRSIAALILAGDNPANLIAVHNMYAKQDAAKQQIVGSPDFQDSMHINQVVHGLSPMDAYAATAKQYGVQGYAPTTTTDLQPVDLAPGGPSAGTRQQVQVPELPVPSTADVVKAIDAQTLKRAYTTGDPLDQLLARYQGVKLTPPYGVQAAQADQFLGSQEVPGVTGRTMTLTDGKLSTTVKTLPPGEQVFMNTDYARKQQEEYNVVHEHLGLPQRLDFIPVPSGGAILQQTTDEAQKAQQTTLGTAGATAYLKTLDPRYLNLPGAAMAPGTPVGSPSTPAGSVALAPMAPAAPPPGRPFPARGPLVGTDELARREKAQEDADKLAATNTDAFQKLNDTLNVMQTKLTPAALPGTTTESLSDAVKYKFGQDVKGAMASHGLQSYAPTQPLYDLESTVDSLKVPLSRALGDKNVRYTPEMIRIVGKIFPNRYDTLGVDGTGQRKVDTLRAVARALQLGTPPAGTGEDAQQARDAWAENLVADTIAQQGGAGRAAAPAATGRTAAAAPLSSTRKLPSGKTITVEY